MDFSAFDEEFKPEDPFSGNQAEDLTDGDYEFLIREAKLKEKNKKSFLELKLEVLTSGKHEGALIFEKAWLTSIDGAKRFGATLKRFGFDADKWTPENGRPFSTEFPKSIRWLVGMRVTAKKVTNVVSPKFAKDTEKIYHNIYFKGRSEVEDGVPRKIGQAELNQLDPNQEEDPFAESA